MPLLYLQKKSLQKKLFCKLRNFFCKSTDTKIEEKKKHTSRDLKKEKKKTQNEKKKTKKKNTRMDINSKKSRKKTMIVVLEVDDLIWL